MFKFFDYHKITPISNDIVDINFRDSYGSGVRRGLEVILDATHSGVITGNLKGYIPTLMESGAKTFVNKRHSTKILKQHKLDKDPVGVITGAEYIHTIPDFLKNDRNVHILTNPNYSIDKQIKAFKNLIRDGVLTSPDWEGLGYIQLKAAILDEQTIQQVQDGRFDSVSTHFQSPGYVYCSECGQNLATDGFCEHSVGEIYKDEIGSSMCIWIPGMHDYLECSLVTIGADPLNAIRVEGAETYNFTQDQIKQDNINSKRSTLYIFKDFKIEEEQMPGTQDLKLNEEETKILDLVKSLRSELSEEDAIALTKKVLAEKKDGYFHKDQKEAEIADELAIEYLLDFWDSKDKELNADEIYQEFEKEFADMGIKDKALTAKERKNLSKSTFCGPNKSFPIPDHDQGIDCAHVVVGRRLIGRYKGPGDKTSILACINRKAKALGCESSDSVEMTDTTPEVTPDAVVFTLPTCEMLKYASDSDAKLLYDMLEAELVSRKLKLERPCAACATKDAQVEIATQDKDTLTKELDELKNQLKYLRDELRTQSVEYTELADQLFEVQTSLFAEKVNRAATLGVLAGKYKTVEDSEAAYRTSNIDTELTVLADSLDLVKMSAKLNDGMANTPTGEVLDPTIAVDSPMELMLDKLSAPAKAAIKNIKEYMDNNQIRQAKQLYDTMVKMKQIDSFSIPFDTFSAKQTKADE